MSPSARRPAAAARLTSPSSVLALDLGASRIRTAVVLPDGRLLGRQATHTPGDTASLVRACATALRASLAAVSESPDELPPPNALGISSAGPVDPFRGELLDPPNMDRRLWNFPLARALEAEIGLPAVLDLDVHVAALAEGAHGAAVGLTDYIYVTVSTGVGGAVVTGGRLMRGADGLAGELGHLMIDIDGPVCGCGARGHLEAFSSGAGIARAARESGLGEIDAAAVAALERQGDEQAGQIMERAHRAFAEAAVSMVDIFNPQRIIVGGGIAAAEGERLLGPARAAIADHAYRRQGARVELVQSVLGDDVGLVGALSLVGLARLGDDAHVQEAVSGAGRVALPATPPTEEHDGD